MFNWLRNVIKCALNYIPEPIKDTKTTFFCYAVKFRLGIGLGSPSVCHDKTTSKLSLTSSMQGLISLVPHTPFGKSRRGLVSCNTAIQCLVPKEFNQSRNHMLMFIYAVKIEVVRSCMACMIEQILIMSVRQRGTSLGVETAVTIHQQATFTSRSLARAAKVTGACMFYCPYNYSLCRNRTVR